MKSIQLHRCIYPTGTVHKNVQVSIRELTQPIHKIGSQSHGIHWEAGSWPLRWGRPTSGPFGEITLVAGWASRRTLLSECLRMSDPPNPRICFEILGFGWVGKNYGSNSQAMITQSKPSACVQPFLLSVSALAVSNLLQFGTVCHL